MKAHSTEPFGSIPNTAPRTEPCPRQRVAAARRPRLRAAPRVAAWALATVLALPASAATMTWSGASGTDWATGGNWIGNTAPANTTYTDAARFADTDPAPANKTPTLTANRNITTVIFDDSTGWTIGGAAYSLKTRGLTASGTGQNTIAAKFSVVEEANHAWSVATGSTVRFTGSEFRYFGYDAGVFAITVTGGGTLHLDKSVLTNNDQIHLENATMRVEQASPVSNHSGAVKFTGASSKLQLKTTVAAATALIGTRILDGTEQEQGLLVTDLGDGYVEVTVKPLVPKGTVILLR